MSDAGPTTGQRRFVGVILALLVVPGLGGFELWPLTGWKLFSANRDATLYASTRCHYRSGRAVEGGPPWADGSRWACASSGWR